MLILAKILIKFLGFYCRFQERLEKISIYYFFQARTLENQIDVKLVSLSKFGTNLGQARSKPASDRKTNADRQPLLANGSTSDTEDEQSDKCRDEVYKTCFAVIDSNKILYACLWSLYGAQHLPQTDMVRFVNQACVK